MAQPSPDVMNRTAIMRQLHTYTAYREFMRFAMVGVLNTLVDVGIYVFLTRTIDMFGVHILWAKAISFVAATICSFVLNRKWTFKVRGRVRIWEIIRFYSTVGSAIFINLGAVYVLHRIFHIHDIIAVLAATILTMLWNFLFTKFWVFKKTGHNHNN